ncbi:MAG: 6-pyruvoyl-tetrahydropterin synthase-related protein [Patescibacteria group bacterium]
MAKINWQKLLKTLNLKYFWILALVLAIPACLALFRHGFFPTHDYIYVARIQQMFESLKAVQFPVRWVSGFRYGEPLYNFYAPLPYYLGALVHLMGFTYLTTAKILYALSFALSGLTMYFLAKKFLQNWPSLAISVLYVYAPYRSVDIYVRGAMSEAWTFVFFPLIILFTILLLEKFSKKILGFLILSLAGLFLTHNILTMLFIPFYLIFCVFWLWKDRSWAFVKRISLALGLGIGVAATYLFPAFLEKGFVQTQNLTQLYFNYIGHFVALRQFIVPSWGYGASLWGPVDDMSFQVGLVHWSVFVLALGCAFVLFKKRKDRKIKVWSAAMASLFIFSLFMQHNRSTYIWQLIPPLGFVQFPWRFLALSVFFITLGGIPAFYFLNKKISLWLSLMVIVLAVAVNIGYFKPDMYYDDSIDAHYVSVETLSVDSKLPKDYLPIWVKVIKEEKITIPQILEGEVEILNFQQKGTRIILTTKSFEGGTIEVPATFFPGWQARMDGQKVETFAGDDLGLVAFKVPAGEHDIIIRFENTPIRTISNLLSFLSLGVVFIFLIDTKDKIKLFKKI